MGLIAADATFIYIGPKSTSDAYVKLYLKSRGAERAQKTKAIKGSLSPVWEDSFNVNVFDPEDVIVFEVWGSQEVGQADNPLGVCEFPVDQLVAKKKHDFWLRIIHTASDGTPLCGGGLKVQLKLKAQPGMWRWGWILSTLAVPEHPLELPRLNLNDLVRKISLLLSKFDWIYDIQPAVFSILFWSRPILTALALVLWVVGCVHMESWPSAICLSAAVFMLVSGSLKEIDSFNLQTSSAHVPSHLGSCDHGRKAGGRLEEEDQKQQNSRVLSLVTPFVGTYKDQIRQVAASSVIVQPSSQVKTENIFLPR